MIGAVHERLVGVETRRKRVYGESTLYSGVKIRMPSSEHDACFQKDPFHYAVIARFNPKSIMCAETNRQSHLDPTVSKRNRSQIHRTCGRAGGLSWRASTNKVDHEAISGRRGVRVTREREIVSLRAITCAQG